jgi:putative addiction module antidote
MFKEVKLQRSGGSSSVNLPKAMLDRHNLDTGETAYAVDTEDGILITPYDPSFAKAMEIADRGSKKYRNALRELSK